MSIYSFYHNSYEFVFRTEERKIEVYEGGSQRKIELQLPPEVKWENLELVLKDESGKSELGEKLSQICKEFLKIESSC